MTNETTQTKRIQKFTQEIPFTQPKGSHVRTPDLSQYIEDCNSLLNYIETIEIHNAEPSDTNAIIQLLAKFYTLIKPVVYNSALTQVKLENLVIVMDNDVDADSEATFKVAVIEDKILVDTTITLYATPKELRGTPYWSNNLIFYLLHEYTHYLDILYFQYAFPITRMGVLKKIRQSSFVKEMRDRKRAFTNFLKHHPEEKQRLKEESGRNIATYLRYRLNHEELIADALAYYLISPLLQIEGGIELQDTLLEEGGIAYDSTITPDLQTLLQEFRNRYT